jgi:flagellar hook-associated protein 3 FlgL
MRISDLLVSNNYLYNLNNLKSKEAQLQYEIATGNKVNRPSDSPSGAAKILQYLNKISQTDGYSSNIQNSLSALNETSFAMENIQSEVVNVLTDITEINNVENNDNLDSYADQIDLSLQAMLDAANSKYDGKYLFGGTDFGSVPYGFSADGSTVEVKVNDVSGVQKVKLSQNITQKINITGTELFGTILTQKGALDINSAVGDSSTSTMDIQDAAGNSYTFSATYTKTAADTYSLSYDVADSGGNSIFGSPPATKTITFDPDSGRILSLDGTDKFSFNIKDSSNNIDFNFDLSFLKESDSPSLTINANQQNDIFNTLVQIRDNLRLGIKPTDEQEQIVNDFNSRILDKISNAGNIINQLYDANDLLSNQKIGFQELLSKEQDVDVAQSVMDLQNQDYLLQVAYKLASTYLPKSLLDYL